MQVNEKKPNLSFALKLIHSLEIFHVKVLSYTRIAIAAYAHMKMLTTFFFFDWTFFHP